jgi:putative peptide zinc metalloprotease protein
MSLETLESALSQSEVPGDAPNLKLRLRPDLIAVEQVSPSHKKWVVKDPMSLEYFHFGEQEWFVLACLRQPTTIKEIQKRFRERFPPLQISLEEIKLFLNRIVRDNLVIIDGQFGLGEGFFFQAAEKRENERRFRWVQILYIRFQGIDPHRILSLLTPVGRVLFHPLLMIFATLVMGATLAFIVAQFDQIVSQWPQTIELFTAHNLMLMAVVIGLVKICHELAHGLACRHLGGECRELGVLLLAFVPCLYCNVSDTWLEPSKWKRMMVSAAGIYVELILAVICFAMWYTSQPGILNSICLNVVIICSINTIFINGNPLLRYDGYYLLADFVEVPNLANQAKSVLGDRIKNTIFWMPDSIPPLTTRELLLATYGVASFFYRIFVIGAILFGVHFATKAFDAEFVGNLLICVALAGVLLPLLYRTLFAVRMGAGKMKIKLLSTFLLVSVVLGIVVLFVRVPIPFQKKAPVVVELRDPVLVFAPRNGQLSWVVEQGDSVRQGDPIAMIENLDLIKRNSMMEVEIDEKSSRLATLRLRAKDETDQLPELPILETEIAELRKQLAALEREIKMLTLISPCAGVIYPAPPRRPQLDPRSFLNQWHGSLMDPSNAGCFVERGQPLCLLGDPDNKKIAMYLNQDWIGEVESGTKVDIRFDHAPHLTVEGQVSNIVGESVRSLPEALVANRRMPVRKDNAGRVISAEPVFRIDCELSGHAEVLPGSTGTANVWITDKTSYERLAQFVNRTFRIDW